MRSYDFRTVLENQQLVVQPVSIETMWVNITRRCNQSCFHCHVGASPERTEQMDDITMEQCLKTLGSLDSCKNLDITGGAPELHPNFEYLVERARELGKHVIVRHNLTVTIDGDINNHLDKTYLPSFFSANQVELLASLPHFTRDVTDCMRGEGVFDKSITSLRQLNEFGYGQQDTDLKLNMVCNIDGPVSHQGRTLLELAFKKELMDNYGIVFNRLFAVTNVPINRYLKKLNQSNKLNEYMDRLMDTFDPEAISDLVCRYLISIGYNGYLYDCDFNQMLDLSVLCPEPITVFNFDIDLLLNRQIRLGPHCFGCTSGGGSS
ncbi:arsenosugar biosynthesis radical SAM (seleno)protein ArsS [Chloroflexota bacterium]